MQRCPDAITQYIITRLLNYVKQWFLGKYLWLCNGEHLSIISRQGPGGNGKQDDLRRSWSRYRMMLFDWEIACFFFTIFETKQQCAVSRSLCRFKWNFFLAKLV